MTTEEWLAWRAHRAQVRREFAEARDAGLQQRHQRKEYVMRTITERKIRCRMTDMYGDRCTAEALSATADVLICRRHAALVLELIRAGMSAGESTPLRVRL